MNNRIEINDEALETIVGGNITFDWDGHVGHCGLNGDKSYTFDSRSDFVAAVTACYKAGMSDAECMNKLAEDKVIHI